MADALHPALVEALKKACTADVSSGVCAYPACQGPDGDCDFAPGYVAGFAAGRAVGPEREKDRDDHD